MECPNAFLHRWKREFQHFRGRSSLWIGKKIIKKIHIREKKSRIATILFHLSITRTVWVRDGNVCVESAMQRRRRFGSSGERAKERERERARVRVRVAQKAWPYFSNSSFVEEMRWWKVSSCLCLSLSLSLSLSSFSSRNPCRYSIPTGHSGKYTVGRRGCTIPKISYIA